MVRGGSSTMPAPVGLPKPEALWQVRGDYFQDGKYCRLADGVPQSRNTGDASVNEENGFLRNDIVWVFEVLLRQPQHATAMRGQMEKRLGRTATSSDGTFKDAGTLGKVANDEQFLVSWLVTRCGLKAAMLDKIKSWDPGGLKQLFFYELSAQPGLQMPDECKSKQVASLALTARADAVGQRIKDLAVGKGVKANGALRWYDFGPYKLEMNKGRVTHIQHRPSKVRKDVPSSLNLTRDYTLESGFSDLKARAVYGLNKVYLHEVVESTECPNDPTHKVITGKSSIFQGIVKKVVAEQEARDKEASQGKVKLDDDAAAEFGSARKKARYDEPGRRARAALQAKAKELNNKRSTQLGS